MNTNIYFEFYKNSIYFYNKCDKFILENLSSIGNNSQ
jgi:hypothetical protein